MKAFKGLALIVIVLSLVLTSISGAAARAKSSFDWMPNGGSVLLIEVLAQANAIDTLGDLARQKKNEKQWREYLGRYKDAWGHLTDSEKTTLATYLATNFPMPEKRIPRDAKALREGRFLPQDGKQLILDGCQACHSVAVPVQHKLDFTGWKGVITTGTHAGLDLDNTQRDEMAHYAAINFPIPEKNIPKALLAPLSGY